MGQRDIRGSSSRFIFRAFAVSLTYLRDLDSKEKWIWPKGKVEIWQWLNSRRMRMTKMMMLNVATGLADRKEKEGQCVPAVL